MPFFPTKPGRDPDPTPAPLWAAGEFALRVRGPGPGRGRTIRCRRPFGLIGRLPGVDCRLDDPAVSARHVYLHLDRRGLFAVDLATRTGTRVGPEGRSCGWLRPGEALEVAGRRVELVGLTLEGPGPVAPGPADRPDDPLADTGSAPLVRATLLPLDEPGPPLVLNSELIFLGRSSSCGIRVEGPEASRAHCVLARTAAAAFAVDLAGRRTWINDRPLQGAAPLAAGDVLTVGAARFECWIEPPGSAAPPALAARPAPPATLGPRGGPPAEVPAWHAELLPAGAAAAPSLPPLDESQAALLTWMAGLLRASQEEMLRRQAEFQSDVTRVLRDIQGDQADLLGKHLEKVEAIHRDLSTLRDEVRRRFGPTEAPARPGPPKPPPLKIARPSGPTPDPDDAAAWLLNRVNQLDQQNRDAWKNLLGRLGRK